MDETSDMKTCFKCYQAKPLSDFYKHPQMADGHLNKCKECAKKDTKVDYHADREKHAAYERERELDPARKSKKLEYQKRRRARSPEKDKARRDLGNAVRHGRITVQPCGRCGSTVKVEAHHHDYSKPLDVHWLCRGCHLSTHGKREIRTGDNAPKPGYLF